jgi:hypothetical protein
MKSALKTKADLEKKFQKVLQTPASFAFFEAIHDFIEYVEETPSFSKNLTYRDKISRELNIPAKYGYLRQIYQGLEDAAAKTNKDLGHARYMVVRDLSRIEENEVSESNFFWKKREVFRKLVSEVYERLSADA